MFGGPERSKMNTVAHWFCLHAREARREAFALICVNRRSWRLMWAVVLFTNSSDLLIVPILALLLGTSSSRSKSAHLLLRIKMNCLNALNVFSALALF